MGRRKNSLDQVPRSDGQYLLIHIRLFDHLIRDRLQLIRLFQFARKFPLMFSSELPDRCTSLISKKQGKSTRYRWRWWILKGKKGKRKVNTNRAQRTPQPDSTPSSASSSFPPNYASGLLSANNTAQTRASSSHSLCCPIGPCEYAPTQKKKRNQSKDQSVKDQVRSEIRCMRDQESEKRDGGVM